MKRICVFCGSSSGNNSKYAKSARNLGATLAEQDVTLVYGGSNIGLMGEIANSMIDRNGNVIGIIPQVLVDKEVAFTHLQDLRIVNSMHERKALMAELADGFISMPGGFGTLEETIEMLTWTQLGIHEKPIGLFNIEGYFDRLCGFIDHMVLEGFLVQGFRDMLLMDHQPDGLLDKMIKFRPPQIDKWWKDKLGKPRLDG
ncbi:MAG: TIGR00730 family Rossman fold protein [Desulfobacteraceae bacterium]|nr:TIGR00730 family Rossman fold protein [Desulfobacteraceae bacterium]